MLYIRTDQEKIEVEITQIVKLSHVNIVEKAITEAIVQHSEKKW